MCKICYKRFYSKLSRPFRQLCCRCYLDKVYPQNSINEMKILYSCSMFVSKHKIQEGSFKFVKIINQRVQEILCGGNQKSYMSIVIMHWTYLKLTCKCQSFARNIIMETLIKIYDCIIDNNCLVKKIVVFGTLDNILEKLLWTQCF